MTAVYLVRHPQTTWNQEQRYQGRLEAPLSDAGRQQASLLAAGLRDARFDVVVSSPLARALDLARCIAASAGSPLHVDERLTEIGMGPWEGLQRSEIERRFPDLYRQWYSAPDRVRFPGGETAEEVQTRALGVMSTLVARYPAGSVLAVTHSVVIQTLASASLGLGLAHIHSVRAANCGISTFCGESVPLQLLCLNSAESVYGGLVQAAEAQKCAVTTNRRPTA